MKSTTSKRLFSVFLSAALLLQSILPLAAYANEHPVQLENHSESLAQAKRASGIVIDGVDAPKANAPLDTTAEVRTAEDDSWDIGVLWVRDDLQFATGNAEEGRSYLPVLAYFTPKEYAPGGDAFTVTLSDSLTKLFGTNDIVSVYSERHGITYILPASLIGLFTRAGAEAPQAEKSAVSPSLDQQPSDEQHASKSLVDIYCAQTAREHFTDADLEWIIDLIINYLEPQAVELLLNSFPAFREAANNGQIGTRIGLYIYYDKGDGDVSEHATVSDALAYVSGNPKMVDGALKYCYLLAVNLEGLTKLDKTYDPIFEPLVDPSTGKYMLVREGKELETLKNTIVHELFHALMDDYNRTAMTGALTLQDASILAKGIDSNDKIAVRYRSLVFPTWFVEGSASTVENVYQYRYDSFQNLRRQQGADYMYGTGDLSDRFTNKLVLNNYLYAMDKNGAKIYYDIGMSGVMQDNDGNKLNTSPASYVTGYLATLYLCDLAVRSMNSGQSAITTTNGVTTVSSAKLREGLNAILKRSHEGETLDSIVNSLSPLTNGKKAYANTDEFTKRFIKGTWDTSTQIDLDLIEKAIRNGEDPSKFVANEMDYADMDSLNFATTFLNYLLDVETKLGNNRPNGSILRDFDENFTSPLDASKQTNSPNLKIIESNEAVESSVSGNTTIIGAGKSNPDAVAAEQGSSQEASVPETQPQVPEAQAKAPEVPEAPAAPETSVTPEAPEAPKAETKTPEAPAAEDTQRQNS